MKTHPACTVHEIRDVTTSMVGLRNGHLRKNLTQNDEPQRYSWEQKENKEGKDLSVFEKTEK